MSVPLFVTILFGIFGVSSSFTPLPQPNAYTQASIQAKLSKDSRREPFAKLDQRKKASFIIEESKRTTLISSLRSTGSDEVINKSEVKGVIIAGAPASGKGTQCELIKERYDLVHLSTGDMLRLAVEDKTPVGISAKGFMDSGKLVPDDIIIGIVKDRLNKDDCKEKGWLLDGFPRTAAQADALAEAGVCADCFIFLNVPDEALVERVVGRRTDPVTGKIYHMTFSPPEDETILARLTQRSDDTEEKVKVRLAQFHANVDAVKGKYSDIAVVIDGSAKPEDVASAISSGIDSKMSI